MKNMILLISLLAGIKASAFSGGTLTCHFEILTTHNSSKLEKLPEFTIDINKTYMDAFKSNNLTNNLYVAYSPGMENSKDVNIFAMDLMYDGADGGADVPVVNNRNYTFYVSKQGTELIGAYLKCVSNLKD